MSKNKTIEAIKKLAILELKGKKLLKSDDFLGDLPEFNSYYESLVTRLEEIAADDPYIVDKLSLLPLIEVKHSDEFSIQVAGDGTLSYFFFPANIYYKYKQHKYINNCKMRIRQIRRVCRSILSRMDNSGQHYESDRL